MNTQQHTNEKRKVGKKTWIDALRSYERGIEENAPDSERRLSEFLALEVSL